MSRDFEVKGGAGEFEAAIIAVVLDRIAREEAAGRRGKGKTDQRLTAWVRASHPEAPNMPRDQVRPE